MKLSHLASDLKSTISLLDLKKVEQFQICCGKKQTILTPSRLEFDLKFSNFLSPNLEVLEKYLSLPLL